MKPIWICSRCGITHAVLDLAEFDPARMSCADCLTRDEVRDDLRRYGIEPDGLAKRILDEVLARIAGEGKP